MCMTIRHLKVFICVVENNGITRAAEVLYIAQPAVSQTIAEMEKHYGVKLFDRLNRKLYLTHHGEKLLTYARQVCGNFDEIERAFDPAVEGGLLRIGATVTIGTCLLPEYISKFTSTSKAKISVQVSNSASIEKLILDSKIDVGLVEGMIENRDIITIPFYKDSIIFVARDKNVKLEYLILREQGSGSREAVVSNLDRLGVQIPNTWTMSNTECIKNVLKKGIGIGALSSLLLTEELESNTLVKLELGDINRNFVIAYHKNKILNNTINEFLKMLKV